MRFGPEGIECIQVARLGKPVGVDGGIALWWRDPFSAFEVSLGVGDFFFFQRDGLLVPYRIVELASRSEELSTVRVRGVTDVGGARELSGISVYALASRLGEASADVAQAVGLEGYTVIDQTGRPIGTIQEDLVYSFNVVLRVLQPGGREVLLPFHSDLLLAGGVDEVHRQLHLRVASELLTV